MLPSGIFFQTHPAEAGYVRTRPQLLWFIAFLLALAVAPLLASVHVTGVLTMLFITVIAVQGLQITTGMTGQLNLGQSAFVGVGAFVTAKLAELGAPVIVALPCAGVAAGLSSILFGLPAVRVKGFYLALTTLAAQVMFPVLVIRLPASWFGGSSGISIDPPVLAGISLGGLLPMYFLCLVVMLVMGVFAFNLNRSRVGRAFRALRDNDIAANVLGVSPAHYKVLSFFAGAFFAGIAGCLYAYNIRYVTTEQFSLWQSVWYVGMLLVGGLHSPLGAILGAVFITVLQETLHGFGGMLLNADIGLQGGLIFAVTNVMLGGVIVAALIYEPRGLVHRWGLIKAAYRLWPFPHG